MTQGCVTFVSCLDVFSCYKPDGYEDRPSFPFQVDDWGSNHSPYHDLTHSCLSSHAEIHSFANSYSGFRIDLMVK